MARIFPNFSIFRFLLFSFSLLFLWIKDWMYKKKKKASLVFLFPIFSLFSGELSAKPKLYFMLHGEKHEKNRKISNTLRRAKTEIFFFGYDSSSRHCQLKFVLIKRKKIVERKIGEEIEKIDSQTQIKRFPANTDIAH